MSEFCMICACLFVLGAFYTFAGVAATRAALTSFFFDWALAQISAKKPSRTETLRTVWILSAATLVLAGGLSLMMKLEVSAWVFLVSALGQAFYIAVLAPRFFDVEDPPEAADRRQTVNAFVIYALVTAGIAWSASAGHLTEHEKTPPGSYALLALAIALHIAYVMSRFMKLKTTRQESGSGFDRDQDPGADA